MDSQHRTDSQHPMDSQFMKRAIELSKENLAGNDGGPFGAVIVKNGKIIGEGKNQVTGNNDPTCHAEIQAIRSACSKVQHFELIGCDIYTSCEPCPMCLAAIYWARLETIYYGNTRKDAAAIKFDDDFIYSEISLDPAKRTIPMQMCLHKEAQEVFRSWEKKTDKIPY